MPLRISQLDARTYKKKQRGKKERNKEDIAQLYFKKMHRDGILELKKFYSQSLAEPRQIHHTMMSGPAKYIQALFQNLCLS